MDKEKLKKRYESACNAYIHIFCKKQDIEFDFWVADEVGGIACFISQYFFNLSDIILDIETEQPRGSILDWQNTEVDRHFAGEEKPYINYKSYTMGLRIPN